MAAAGSASCRVSFRESIAKLKWTASSLGSLKSAEERLLVSLGAVLGACEALRVGHLTWQLMMMVFHVVLVPL